MAFQPANPRGTQATGRWALLRDHMVASPGVQRWWEIEKQFFSPQFQAWVDAREAPHGLRPPWSPG